MTDDIVARLRVLNHHAKKLAENESLHDLHRDALTRCENLTWQAADLIERLRAERDQAEPLLYKFWSLRTDATKMRVEINRLQNDLDGSQLAYRGASYDRDRMRAERDEARREVCAFVSGRYSKDVVTLDRSAALEEAKQRGWDCFNEVNQ